MQAYEEAYSWSMRQQPFKATKEYQKQVSKHVIRTEITLQVVPNH